MEPSKPIAEVKKEDIKKEENKKDDKKIEEAKNQDPKKEEEKKKKKKKKKKKAEKKNEDSAVPTVAAPKEEAKATILTSRKQDNSAMRKINSWKDAPYMQNAEATIPITAQYKVNEYPKGAEFEYKGENSGRMKSVEKQEKEKLFYDQIVSLRRAAECHRQVRRYAQSFIKPGMPLLDIANRVEEAARRLIECNKIEAGLAFPCGTSINNCAAHFSANIGETRVLKSDDVMKVDFGTHVKGLLIDSAFTVCFDSTFDNLLQASIDGTNTGVREAGIDARLDEIGEKIQEAIESHEVEIKGKTYQIKPVRNLNGHLCERYRIHAGKSVPIVKGGPSTKMEEGEVYAIETFASTGKGYVMDDSDTSHYMRDFEMSQPPIKDGRAKFLLKIIEENYSTLAFSRKWLTNELKFDKVALPLKHLVDCGAIVAYPPLCDISGSYVSQFEHTLILKPTCKEVLSAGDDY